MMWEMLVQLLRQTRLLPRLVFLELPSKDHAMRVLMASFLLAGLLLTGCTAKNTIVQPTTTVKAPDAGQIIDNTPKMPAPTQPK